MISPALAVDRGIEVWPVDLDAPESAFLAVLSHEERARAARFHFDHLRRDFTVARGVLRLLLAARLELNPSAVSLRVGSRGKPFTEGLHFNVSHCGSLALFAFAYDCELGVDLEAIRPMPDLIDIALRFFCPEETAELLALPAADRARAFFHCWTRKEAYVKATGEGLQTPLDRFRVSLDPPARFLHIDGRHPGGWVLHDLPVASTYAAALAYAHGERPIHLMPRRGAMELSPLTATAMG